MNKKYEKIIVSKSELFDVYELAPHLRDDDLRELNVFNLSAEQGLLRGYIYSDECFTARYKNKIICMFGVSGMGMPLGCASIWFLGSDDMVCHALTFLKDGRKYINYFLSKYKMLINAVDKRNKTHINWIKKVGLMILEPIIINGFEFLPFCSKQNNCKFEQLNNNGEKKYKKKRRKKCVI